MSRRVCSRKRHALYLRAWAEDFYSEWKRPCKSPITEIFDKETHYELWILKEDVAHMVLMSKPDYHKIVRMEGRWTITRNHNRNGTERRYAQVRFNMDGKTSKFYVHRLVNQTPISMETDHRNRNSLDNRRGNLRDATPAQNNLNANRKGHTSKVRPERFNRIVEMIEQGALNIAISRAHSVSGQVINKIRAGTHYLQLKKLPS